MARGARNWTSSLRPRASGPTDQRTEGTGVVAGVVSEVVKDAAEAPDAVDSPHTIDTIDTMDDTVGTIDVSEEANVALEGPTTVVGRARSFVQSNPLAGYPLLGIVGFMGVTFVVAVVKTVARGASKTGRRTKQVNKNLAVVKELSKYLPDNRAGLSGRAIAGIRLRTGFKPAEIFRKYLWYLLRERKFGPDCVEDLVVLRAALDLSDDELSAAMKERAERVYAQFGTVMMDTSSMTNAGIERKATAKSLFSKMLYLLECEQLWTNNGGTEVEERSEMLRDVFGASSDDLAKLRLASIHTDIDLEKLFESDDGEAGDDGAASKDEE